MMEVVVMETVSSREFNRDVSAAKRAADHGPVVVTDRGEPAYVLLSIAEYRRLTDHDASVFLARLRMDDLGEDVDLTFPPAELDFKVPEF